MSPEQNIASKITNLKSSFIADLAGVVGQNQIPDFKAKYLGKVGFVTNLFKEIAKLDLQQKKEAGALVNELKVFAELQIESLTSRLELEAINASLKSTATDITLPSEPIIKGKIHPLSKVVDEIYAIFKNLGFDLRFDREIESTFYNFDALNFAKLHPARSMHDSFFTDTKDVESGEAYMLRTHTSSVQIRAMLGGKPPFCFLSPGRTYRCDFDRTHTPMFTQVEGVLVGKNISFANLKWIIENFLSEFFEGSDIASKGFDVRFRPSFFPFTEPSAEVDIGIKQKDGSIKYLEVLGCGLIHPNVLAACGIDSNTYSGLAFGLGAERFAMLKYNIEDLRDFFENKSWWLSHYGA